MKKAAFCTGTVFVFAFALLFPRESLAGARAGLLLWYNTLLPSLFPVMILSRLLLKTGLAFGMSRVIARPFAALFGISPSGVYALLTGFLCGCPMGAKVLADLREDGKISRAEASYLVKFCNNLSPAFFVNYLVLQHLTPAVFVPALVSLFGAPLLYGLFTGRRGGGKALPYDAEGTPDTSDTKGAPDTSDTKSAPDTSKNKAPATAAAMVDACIMDSICGITKLGGYVILFSVAVSAAGVLTAPFPLIKAVLSGVMEVSGGIGSLAALPFPFRANYLMMIAASAFGGLCCAAQSSQMLARIGISVKEYLRARLCIAVTAAVLAALL